MAEYIDREKIAAEARELSTHLLNEWDTMGVLALIDRQPAADVAEVRRGRWLPVKGFEGILYRCSACEDNPYKHTTTRTNYCPDCGALMDESEDEE